MQQQQGGAGFDPNAQGFNPEDFAVNQTIPRKRKMVP
jgi:hypothetical protein